MPVSATAATSASGVVPRDGGKPGVAGITVTDLGGRPDIGLNPAADIGLNLPWEPMTIDGLLDTLGKMAACGASAAMTTPAVPAPGGDVRFAEDGLEGVSNEWIWSGRGLRRQYMQTISIAAGVRLA